MRTRSAAPTITGEPILSGAFISGLGNEGDDMHYELLVAFEAIRGYRARGYRTDLELRRSHRAQRGRRRLFPALRALAAGLSRKGEKR